MLADSISTGDATHMSTEADAFELSCDCLVESYCTVTRIVQNFIHLIEFELRLYFQFVFTIVFFYSTNEH